MKRIKLNLALIAMVLGCTVAFAFKAPAKRATLNEPWTYVSGPVTSPSSYSAGQPSCPQGSNNICYIEAPSDGNTPAEPVISTDLATKITDKNTMGGEVFLKH
jgi:hypothetical protein